MKAIHLTAIISLLLLLIACVPTAEELAGINKTNKTPEIKEPEVEIKQEITIIPSAQDNKTIKEVEIEKENTTNTTQNTTAQQITTAAQTQPQQIASNTIVYTGGAIEMGEGEKASVIIK